MFLEALEFLNRIEADDRDNLERYEQLQRISYVEQRTKENRMKPWKGSREGAVLAAYLGCWGCKTGQIGSMEELNFLATRIYELPDGLSPAEVGDRIEALGKKERRRLAYTNIPALFPEPDEVWPGDIPPRRGFRPSGAEPDGPGSIEGASPAVLSAMMKHSRPHLIDGEPFGVDGELDIDPAKLLRKVVSAVISAGHASDLYEFPDVLAFFGSRIPEADDADLC